MTENLVEVVRAAWDRLVDPEARWERGEAATRASMAALAELYLPEILNRLEWTEATLYPRPVCPECDHPRGHNEDCSFYKGEAARILSEEGR